MKIYTRTGDGGQTALVGGTRVSKADPRVDAYGDVDELNAALGVARAEGLAPDLDEMVVRLQADMFAIGARLADPGDRLGNRVEKAAVDADDVTRLESWIDRLETELAPLTKFILPGGSASGAALHLARTICRRAERRIVALDPPPAAVVLAYVNRVSDLLFVMARVANRRVGRTETEW